MMVCKCLQGGDIYCASWFIFFLRQKQSEIHLQEAEARHPRCEVGIFNVEGN